MKEWIKNFSFPHKGKVLLGSTLLLLAPFLFTVLVVATGGTEPNRKIVRLVFLVSSLIWCIGFVYCTIGYHFQTLRGDELKLRIHLESLHIALTTVIAFLFVLIFTFINFAPTMLNYILVILAIIGIVAYLLAIEFVKEKYE